MDLEWLRIQDREGAGVDLLKNGLVRGSARGVRVVASAWAALLMLASAFFFAMASLDLRSMLVAIPFLGVAAFLGVRPWYLGMYIVDERVVCKNWYRSRSIDREQIVEIGLHPVSTLMTGPLVGFVPLIGRVRMVTITYREEGREKIYWAYSVFGRFATMQKIAVDLRRYSAITQQIPDF